MGYRHRHYRILPGSADFARLIGSGVGEDKRLNAIYVSNFSCGPDSFLTTFFKELMRGKPALVLEIDEHSADAGVITRLEAFFDSVKNAS